MIDLGDREVLALEIKAGETFNPDYLKNLRKINTSKELRVSKSLLYLGDVSSEMADVSIISWKDYRQRLLNPGTP